MKIGQLGSIATGLLLYKQRQRGRITVQKILLTDRTDFSVAEETTDTDVAKLLLYHSRIVSRFAEKMSPATVAAAKATAVNRRSAQFLVLAGQ